jgi:uncharacterized protein (TIGR02453 family)
MQKSKKVFPGFSKKMPAFFRGLEKNNEREWFNARKGLFELEVKGTMMELVGRLNEGMKKISAEHVGDEPARLMYRIYRDTRFSKDKTPYKTHVGATFPHRVLSRHGGAGFYFEVSHKYVGIAGGVYMPGPEELLAIRKAIAERPKEFVELAEARGVVKMFGALQGERLSRLPKMWKSAEGKIGAEYLRNKQFYFWVELDAELALTEKLEGTILKYFAAMNDVIAWMNAAIMKNRPAGEDEKPLRPEGMW